MEPIITIATGSEALLLGYAGQLFTDFWPLIALAIGVPLAFYIISRAIGLVRARTRK